jgi:drug/metabolite transporter superfamily protein YnfA
MRTFALFIATALAEIVGCYLPYLWLKQGRSAWLLVPAAASLALFAWLLTLHETAAGRVYAAYGGVYIRVAIAFFRPTRVIQVARRALPLAALLSFERMVRVQVCGEASESRRVKVTDSSEDFDKARWHHAADCIRIRLRRDADSSLGQQLGAADLGCPLVESPQRLFAGLSG